MVIIARYEIQYNQKNDIWKIISVENPYCPYCDSLLKYRDSRYRTGKQSSGSKRRYQIRRLKCPDCGKTHTELPDFLHPYKHYEAEVIQNELDEISPSCCGADDSTIRRWRTGWRQTRAQAGRAISSIKARLANTMDHLIHGEDPIMQIKLYCPERWLSFVIRLLIGGGFPIYTKFAFCP